jgi:flavin-dependent dehydrogenase
MISLNSIAPSSSAEEHSRLPLQDGSRIGVIGGGPAGSFFSYFCLAMAKRTGLEVAIDMYEPRDFSRPAPHGCNMCGGIVSESLVQTLAAEGIEIPPTVVQRGIDSYVLHMDVGTVRIDTPLQEKRIAAIHRGLGPRSLTEAKWGSFDGFLQDLAIERGVNVIHERVTEVEWNDDRPLITTKEGSSASYDLLVFAMGVNTATLKFSDRLGLNYTLPRTVKTAIFEYYLGEDTIEKIIGSSMHVFLLNLPRLEFAAIIPKGDYVTVCMMGDDIDKELVELFLNSPEVTACLPPELIADKSSCRCSPRMNIESTCRPFADRILFIGDCGVTRLYKDGIGAAYRTGKTAATAAVFQGVSAESFERHFWPVCKSIRADNSYGKIAFFFTRAVQGLRFARRTLLKMIVREQRNGKNGQDLSRAMWDIFTGSAPYKEVFLRSLHPAAVGRICINLAGSLFPFRHHKGGS